MTDASPAPSAASAPASRARLSPYLLAGMLLVVSLLGVGFWYAMQDRLESKPTVLPTPLAPVIASDQRIDDLRVQLTDLERVNSVLRQQVVALTERVRVLGEQVTLQARDQGAQRLDVRGQTALALADQWLSLAQARFELFADPAGALLALDAADRALQNSSNPRVPSLRQTLSIERESLRVLPSLDTARVAGQLEAWQQALASWPQRPPAAADATASGAGAQLLGKLDRYFKVRPLDAPGGLGATPEQSAISAELGWARVLLARGERAALHVSLQRSAAAIEQRFDTEDSGVQAALAGIQELVNSLSGSTGTPRLGTSLLELRALEQADVGSQSLPLESPLPSAAPTVGGHEDVVEVPMEPASAAASATDSSREAATQGPPDAPEVP